jgi:AraC-like DNA-binding protein
VLNSDIAFAEFIRINHLKYPTVNDLAQAMNMTAQQFSKRFNHVFGQAPYKWMQLEKARLIYGEICRNNKSFKEIATSYGFNIPANFNRFCKTSFGVSPGEIRKKRLIGIL